MAADESTPVPATEETPPEAPAQERTLTAKLKPVNKAPGSAPATNDIAEQGCGALIMNLGNKLRDFADTAAVIAQLDMVISVDTSIAHLAGALGKPVWVVLPYPGDWRWMLDRDDTSWRPTAWLFRQNRPGSWTPVFDRLRRALHDEITGKG